MRKLLLIAVAGRCPAPGTRGPACPAGTTTRVGARNLLLNDGATGPMAGKIYVYGPERRVGRVDVPRPSRSGAGGGAVDFLSGRRPFAVSYPRAILPHHVRRGAPTQSWEERWSVPGTASYPYGPANCGAGRARPQYLISWNQNEPGRPTRRARDQRGTGRLGCQGVGGAAALHGETVRRDRSPTRLTWPTALAGKGAVFPPRAPDRGYHGGLQTALNGKEASVRESRTWTARILIV